MARKPWPSRSYPQPKVYQAGPWLGMRDASEPAAADPRYAKLLRNCYATATDTGVRAVHGIPGFTQAGAQLGAVGARVVQWIGYMRETDGTTRNLVVCNGVVSEYDFGTDAFTTRLTNAQIAAGTGTPAFSTTARVYSLTYNDQQIFSDGTNVAFQWDGTSGAGVTELSNAPVFYGQPIIHFEKLAAIKNAERDTWVWSEEGDPTLGYDTAPYENAWNFGGAKAQRLFALASRNESLGVLRERTTTEVYGAMNAEFNTTANRASVSEQIGTMAPGAVLVLDEGTMTVDADGRPQFWPRGSGYSAAPALWDTCAVTISAVARSQIPNTQIVYDETTNLIMVPFAKDGASSLNTVLLFERTGGVPNFVGYADGYSSTRWGVWIDSDGRQRVVHAGVDDGYLYLHGTPDAGPWSYGLNSGTIARPIEIRPAEMGADMHIEKNFDEFGLEVMLDTDLDLTLGYITPSGTSSTVQTESLATGGAVYGTGLYGTATYAAATNNSRLRVGIAEHGRWMVPSIRHDVVDQQFSVIACDAVAFIEGRDPEIL
ncbi:MAG: hypothetical protein ACYC3L_01070 [Gemmatimonadaceae bacterium]